MGSKTNMNTQERFSAFHEATHHVALPVPMYSCLFYRPQNCQKFGFMRTLCGQVHRDGAPVDGADQSWHARTFVA